MELKTKALIACIIIIIGLSIFLWVTLSGEGCDCDPPQCDPCELKIDENNILSCAGTTLDLNDMALSSNTALTIDENNILTCAGTTLDLNDYAANMGGQVHTTTTGTDGQVYSYIG